jgi:hypothetical protein
LLWALDDPPDGLAELRGVLLLEHEWARPRRARVAAAMTYAEPNVRLPASDDRGGASGT